MSPFGFILLFPIMEKNKLSAISPSAYRCNSSVSEVCHIDLPTSFQDICMGNDNLQAIKVQFKTSN